MFTLQNLKYYAKVLSLSVLIVGLFFGVVFGFILITFPFGPAGPLIGVVCILLVLVGCSIDAEGVFEKDNGGTQK